MAAKILLRREIDKMSLVPLMAGSLPNVATGSYVPVLDGNRRILIDVALSPKGCNTPAAWQNVFEGRIAKPSWDSDPIVLNCIDQTMLPLRTWIETERQYGSTAGTAIETVMQAVLDDNLGVGVVTLFSVNGTVATPWNVGDSSGFVITPYKQTEMSVWDALMALGANIGWDLRYRWHTATPAGFRLVFYNPTRTKTTPDYTFGADGYTGVRQAEYAPENIRNAVRVKYVDSTTGLEAQVVRDALTSSDAAASQARWGRLFCGISKSSTSLIRNTTDATALADAVLSDLCAPLLEHEIETPYNYACQLNDLYKFLANGRHYDTDQTAAAVAFRHSLARDKCSTVVSVRGKPSGGYRRWLGIAGGCRDVPISDGSVSPTSPDLNTFRGENLIPNGDFGSVSAPGGSSPPVGWSDNSYPNASGPYSEFQVWGTNEVEDLSFTTNGHRAIKLSLAAKSGMTPNAYYLHSQNPIPVSVGDVLAMEFTGAADVAISSFDQYLLAVACELDINKEYLDRLEIDLLNAPTPSQYVTTRGYLRIQNASARYIIAHVGAIQAIATPFHAWIDSISICRVPQAAHYAFHSTDTAQTIPASTPTIINWNTNPVTGKLVDVGDVVASGVYSCFQPGMHSVRASVSLAALNSAKTMAAYLCVNGSAVWSKAITTVAGTNTIPFQMSVLLSSGDTVDVRVQHDDSASRDTTLDDQLSYFIGQRVS
jgi:hypothetical protein